MIGHDQSFLMGCLSTPPVSCTVFERQAEKRGGRRERTGLAPGKDVHEGGFAGAGGANKRSQDARPKRAAAVVQQLQHLAAAHLCCARARLLRIRRNSLSACIALMLKPC